MRKSRTRRIALGLFAAAALMAFAAGCRPTIDDITIGVALQGKSDVACRVTSKTSTYSNIRCDFTTLSGREYKYGKQYKNDSSRVFLSGPTGYPLTVEAKNGRVCSYLFDEPNGFYANKRCFTP